MNEQARPGQGQFPARRGKREGEKKKIKESFIYYAQAVVCCFCKRRSTEGEKKRRNH